MSRRYNRKEHATTLASQILARVSTDPKFIMGNYVNPKPKYLPKRIWAWIIKLVIKFPR